MACFVEYDDKYTWVLVWYLPDLFDFTHSCHCIWGYNLFNIHKEQIGSYSLKGFPVFLHQRLYIVLSKTTKVAPLSWSGVHIPYFFHPLVLWGFLFPDLVHLPLTILKHNKWDGGLAGQCANILSFCVSGWAVEAKSSHFLTKARAQHNHRDQHRIEWNTLIKVEICLTIQVVYRCHTSETNIKIYITVLR